MGHAATPSYASVLVTGAAHQRRDRRRRDWRGRRYGIDAGVRDDTVVARSAAGAGTGAKVGLNFHGMVLVILTRAGMHVSIRPALRWTNAMTEPV